jgi:hypothetical protein
MDTHADASAPPSGRRRIGKLAQVIVALVALQAVLVTAFVLPAHKPEPHGVDVAVVGPPELATALEAVHPGALDATLYPSEAAARGAIDERDVYGALVAGPQPRLLVATAASPAIAQLLQGAAQATGPAPAVEDVQPLVAEDPRGATLNLLFLPLVVVCLPAAALLAGLRLSTPQLLGAIGLFAALGGLAVVGLIAGVLDAMPGSYLELSAVAALVILASTLPVTAFVRLLGHGGLPLGALLFVLIGNPASGNGTAPELLPEPWRAIGQLMPSGAGGSALRNVAYFDGNAVLQPLLVLAAYATAGVLLLVGADLLARRRARQASDRPAGVLGSEPLAA